MVVVVVVNGCAFDVVDDEQRRLASYTLVPNRRVVVVVVLMLMLMLVLPLREYNIVQKRMEIRNGQDTNKNCE
jgi:hypothetical protein